MFLSRPTRLRTCCGCFSLRLGCLVLAYIEIAGNSYGIYKVTTGEEEWEDVIVTLLAAIGLAFLNVLLAWGIHTTRKWLMLPWIVIKFIFYLFISIYYGIRIVETAFMFSEFDNQDIKTFVIGFCSLLILLLSVAWYTFFCVYSYYNITFSSAKIEEKKEDKEKTDTKDEVQEKKEQ